MGNSRVSLESSQLVLLLYLALFLQSKSWSNSPWWSECFLPVFSLSAYFICTAPVLGKQVLLCCSVKTIKEQLLFTSRKQHSLPSTFLPTWKFAKYSWHSFNLFIKHTGNSQDAECMVVAMRWTQERVRGSLKVTVQQLGRDSGPKDSRIKSGPVKVHPQVCAVGHTLGLVLGHVESVVRQAWCCFVLLKCSTSSFTRSRETDNGNLRDKANHRN